MPLKNDWTNGDVFTPAAANDMANIVNNAGTRTAFNVKDYGATGDGTTNDRAAIHAARDAAGAGGTLFFPPGTYKVVSVGAATPFGSGGLHANIAGQDWLLGSAEIVLSGADQENLITISAPNVSIIGGTLDLSTVAASQYFNAGIAVLSGTVLTGVYGTYGSGAAGAVIRDVTINNASSHGVHVVGTNSVTVTGCTITNFYSVGVFVQADTTITSDLYDFVIDGNQFNSSSVYAVSIYVGTNDQAAGNFDTAVTRVRRARVTNNSCVIPRGFTPGGPDVGAIQMFNAEDCVIDGNATDGGAFGITTGFLRRCVISSNTCSGWRGIGIEVAGGLDGVAITGNIIDADGAGGPFDATTGAQDAGGSQKQTISGISSSGAKSFRNYTVAGNTITGFTTAARTTAVQLFNTSRPSAGGTFESVTISGNNITAGGGSANYSGVSVFAPTTNLTITGNGIDGSSRTPSTGVGISEGVHNGLSITGNNFSNLNAAATNLSGTFTDVRFTGNVIRNCTTALTGSGVASATRLVVDSTSPSTSTATAAGTTTLTADSTEVQVFTGSTTQTVRLATTNVLAGRRFTVINASTGSVTVQSSNATVLETVKAGNSATFVALQSTPTTGAHWQETALAGADVLMLGGALGTPASATLTNATGLPVSSITASTSAALGVGSVELGHATDTTLSRSSAGVLAVEGIPVVTTTGAATLTAKTLTTPTLSSPNIDGGAGSASIGTTSSATDANLNIFCKGTAAVGLQSLAHGIIFRALSTASAVNYLQASSQIAGTAPAISAVGTDTNIGINLVPKGTGTVSVGGADVLISDGALGTPASATLTNATGLPVSGITASTSTALGVGSVELGHATDTTLSRSSAGVLAVEGVPVVTTSATQTLTSKTLTSPTMTSPKVDGGAGSASMEVSSSATDANLNIYCKGTAAIALQSLTHGIIFRALSTASAVNYLQATSQIAGTAPSLSAVGTDSAIGINLVPKSTGTVTVSGNPVGVKVAVPSTATSTGVVGQFAADSSWLYICTAANTWRRVAIATW